MKQTKWVFWSIALHYPDAPFWDEETAWRFWAWLKKSFSHAICAVLMPNHFHLVLPAGTEEEDRAMIVGLIHAAKRSKGWRGTWKPITEQPEQISDTVHLRRVVRYVLLNPCRSKFVRDPLLWPWSTYRSFFSAVINPWVRNEAVFSALSLSLKNQKLEDWHRYVSIDESTSIVGTPMPRKFTQSIAADIPLEHVMLAACAALEVPRSALYKKGHKVRRLAVQLALRARWDWTTRIAERLGVTPSSVSKLEQRHCPESWIRSGLVCLGDPRLRHIPQAPRLAPPITEPRIQLLKPWATESGPPPEFPDWDPI